MSKDKRHILKVAFEAADKASEILLSYKGRLTDIREKPDDSLVSEADLASENAIIEIIKRDFPEDHIVAEETHAMDIEGDFSGAKWVIDPLDGTTNFIYGLPLYCTSIGVEVNGEVMVGVIKVPELNHIFYAVKGEGAFLKTATGENKISVSSRAMFSKALLATGFIAPSKEKLNQQLRSFDNLIKDARGFRRTGSAAYDLCLVATGAIDVFWEAGLKPWDTSAGSLLVQEAGGSVTTYSGAAYKSSSANILATNKDLHNEAMKRL